MALAWCSFYQRRIANKHFSFKTLVSLLFASNSVSPFQDQVFRGLWYLVTQWKDLMASHKCLSLFVQAFFWFVWGFFFATLDKRYMLACSSISLTHLRSWNGRFSFISICSFVPIYSCLAKCLISIVIFCSHLFIWYETNAWWSVISRSASHCF